MPPSCAVQRAADRPRRDWPKPCIATILRCMAIATPDVSARARAAARELAGVGRARKDAALEAIASRIEGAVDAICEANELDLADARASGTSGALLDRLMLDAARVAALAAAVRSVALLADPVGDTVSGWRLPNGLDVQKVRIPLGVLLVVYEARPNVTADVAALAIKSGNACILRGSSSAAPHERRADRRGALRPRGRRAAGRQRRRLRLQPRRAGRVRRRCEVVRRRDPARRRAAQGLPDQARTRARAGRRRRQLPRLHRREGRPAEGARDHRQREDAAARRVQRGRDAARPPRGAAGARRDRCRAARRRGRAARRCRRRRGARRAEPAGDRGGLGDRVPRPRARRSARSTRWRRRSTTSRPTAPGTPRRS